MARKPGRVSSYRHPPAVDLLVASDDAVSHSLAVLATVYHYNHWIFSRIRDFLGSSVLEVGAGTGNISQFLLNCEAVCCLEPFAPYREFLSARFAKHLNVRVLPHGIEECPNEDIKCGAFDSVVCLNVLEHLEDDAGALAVFKRVLRPGGNAIVLAPALPWLFGAMDESMGHLRRYTRRTLRRAFIEAGLTPLSVRYMNFAGALAWWWRGRVQKKTTVPEKATRVFDRMVPFLAAIEQIAPLPFGQSVVMIGRA